MSAQQPPYRLTTPRDRMRAAGEVHVNQAAIDRWRPELEGARVQVQYLSNVCSAKLALIAAYDRDHAA